MWKMTIDTDSRKLSAVDVYADTSKLSKQSATLDAVGDFCDDVKVYFVGENPPEESDTVELVAAYDGTTSSVLLIDGETTSFFIRAAGERGSDDDGNFYLFRPQFTHEKLRALFEQRATLSLKGAIVATNEENGKHVEFQFSITANRGVYNSTLGVAPSTQGDYSVLMVVKLSYAEYVALCEAGEDEEDVLYVCPDAPNLTEELESRVTSVEAEIENINENTVSSGELEGIRSQIEAIQSDYVTSTQLNLLNEGIAEVKELTNPATSTTFGTVKLSSDDTLTERAGAIGINGNGQLEAVLADPDKAANGMGFGVVRMASSIDDEGSVAVPTAAMVKEKFSELEDKITELEMRIAALEG